MLDCFEIEKYNLLYFMYGICPLPSSAFDWLASSAVLNIKK